MCGEALCEEMEEKLCVRGDAVSGEIEGKLCEKDAEGEEDI